MDVDKNPQKEIGLESMVSGSDGHGVMKKIGPRQARLQGLVANELIS